MDDGPFSDEDGKLESTNGMKDGDEIIGRLQNKDGEDLGEVVVLNKNTNRVRIKLKEGLDLFIQNFTNILIQFIIFRRTFRQKKKAAM